MAGPSIETAIWLALRARIETLVLSPVHPVSWPNEPFTAPQTPPPNPKPAPYLRVFHLPNQSDRLFVDGNDPHRYQGILQISLMSALNQSPVLPGAVVEQAGLIAEHFPADLVLRHTGVSVKIEKRPDVGQGLRDEAATRWMTPVSIRYRAFA